MIELGVVFRDQGMYVFYCVCVFSGMLGVVFGVYIEFMK